MWRAGATLHRGARASHRLQTHRLSRCGSRAQLLHGMWDLPRPGLEPVSPVLAGGFSTAAPPGKPGDAYFKEMACRSHQLHAEGKPEVVNSSVMCFKIPLSMDHTFLFLCTAYSFLKKLNTAFKIIHCENAENQTIPSLPTCCCCLGLWVSLLLLFVCLVTFLD